jgi:hypothetical protein
VVLDCQAFLGPGFYTYIHTTHALIPEGVAEVSQIFLGDAHVLPDVTGGKPIAV